MSHSKNTSRFRQIRCSVQINDIHRQGPLHESKTIPRMCQGAFSRSRRQTLQILDELSRVSDKFSRAFSPFSRYSPRLGKYRAALAKEESS